MTGLIKNNFYASFANLKFFSAVLFILGIFVVIVDNRIPTLLIGYLLLSMVGFSINALTCLGKEASSKWKKYKLTAPVRRSDIIKSHFICHAAWLLAGILCSGICVFLSVSLHGYPFDKSTDLLLLFATGVCVSLIMGAFFYPLFFFGGEERSEAVLIVSLLGAVLIYMALVSLLNQIFGPRQTAPQLVLDTAILLAAALFLFGLSYFTTVRIFKREIN